MRKLMSSAIIVLVLALAGAAFAATKDLGTSYIAEQKVSSVTTGTISDLPEGAHIMSLSVHAPAASVKDKKITFEPAFKEGKYTYQVTDSATGAEVGTYTVWVLDVTTGISIADMAEKSEADRPKATPAFSRNYSLAVEPEEPAAYEFPRGACKISTISWNKDDKNYEFVKEAGGFKPGVARITVNGVLLYDGQYIEGARDSSPLGSFYFVVSDHVVDKARIKWASGGVQEPVEFVLTGVESTNVTAIKVNDKETLAASNYTKTPSDASNTKITIKPEYLQTLDLGPKHLDVEVTNGSTTHAWVVLDVVKATEPKSEAKMSIVPNKVALGDPITVSLDAVTMHDITGVVYDGDDVTSLATYISRRDDAGQVLGTTVHLPSILTLSLDVTKSYDVVVSYDFEGAEKSVKASFEATRSTEREVPGASIKPDDELLKQVPAALSVDFGAPQKTATLFEVQAALLGGGNASLAANAGQYFGEDGKLTEVGARALIGTTEHLTPMATAIATVAKDHVAPITFIVTGDQLASGDVAIDWTSANVYKIVEASGDLKSEKLAPARTMADVKDGAFQIFDHTGTKLAADPISGKRDGTLSSYRLVVYVKDNGRYDLNKAAGVVLDPVVVAHQTQGVSHSSSGSCSAGAGAAALVALLAILRRRG